MNRIISVQKVHEQLLRSLSIQNKMNPKTEELRKRRSEPREMSTDGRDEDEIDSVEQPVSSNGFC